MTPDELAKVRALVHKLNPTAKVITTTYSDVDLSVVLNTGLFNFEQAALGTLQFFLLFRSLSNFHLAPGWLKELRGEHVPETLEYNIASFVYRARKPFHPQRFHDLIEDKTLMEPVLRAKGFVWYVFFLVISSCS